MSDYLLQNAYLVSADRCVKGSLRIRGEKIAAAGELSPVEGETVIDCEGLYVVPGGIETHTHLQLESMGTVTADDFYTGTRAALAGGTTTVLDFATQFHGESMKQGLEHWHKKADGRCFIDYGFHMAMTEWNQSLRSEMESIVRDEGISSFKMYMAYKDNMMVQEDAIYQALAESKRLGATIGFHCENGFLIEQRVLAEKAAGHLSPYYHQLTRPDYFEAEAIRRLDTCAKLLDAPYYVVHLSSAAGLEEIRRARRAGSRVITETCPQYLLLDNSHYGTAESTDFEAAKYIMSPPLRDKANQATLWNALADGEIQFVGTDHCSFNFNGQKDAGKDDFSKIPNGAPGIETRMHLLYSYGVLEKRMSIQRFVAVTSTNAAKHFGLYPEKGSLLPGTDADLVVLDPQGESIIHSKDLHENVDYSSYEGLPLRGKIRDVFMRGAYKVQNAVLHEGEPEGRYLRRTACDSQIC